MMDTGKIAALVGVIVVALGILGFLIYRSNTSSGAVASGEIKQVPAGARAKRVPIPQRAPGQ